MSRPPLSQRRSWHTCGMTEGGPITPAVPLELGEVRVHAAREDAGAKLVITAGRHSGGPVLLEVDAKPGAVAGSNDKPISSPNGLYLEVRGARAFHVLVRWR